MHGRDAEHSYKVSQHALSTAVSAIDDAFADDGDFLDKKVALLVVDMVELILSFDMSIGDKLQRVLLAAGLHAALELLPSVSRADLKHTYRRVLDLIRDNPWDSPHAAPLKTLGINTIKSIASEIYGLDENANYRNRLKVARTEASEVYRRFPVAKVRRILHDHARDLEGAREPLWVHQMHEQDLRGHRRRSANGARKSRSKHVPDFFSDVEEVGETVGRGTDSQWNHVPIKEEPNELNTSPIPMQTDESEDGSRGDHAYDDDTESAALNEEPPKRLSRKRRRSSVEEPAEEPRARRKSRTAPVDEGEGEGRRNLRPRNVPQGAYEESDDERAEGQGSCNESEIEARYPGAGEKLEDERSDDESVKGGCSSPSLRQQYILSADRAEVTDGVTRHSRTRRQRREGKRTSQAQPKSPQVVDKEADPDYNEASPNGGIQSDPEETNSDKDEIERSNVTGHAGEVFRDLHKAGARLKESGMPDPLQASVRDAQRAKHRVRRSLAMRYSPDANARAASPIPGSETPIQRKRRTRVELEGAESSGEERRVSREALFHGRILRTGRFQIYEDDLLVEGLARYGWGMWTQVAKNFGTGRYTRAPMSLKDRARTMGLDPLKYPIPKGSGVKKGRPSFRPQLPTRRLQGLDDEEIQSPGAFANKDAE